MQQPSAGSSANSRQQTAAFPMSTPRLDEQTLLALQQMGFFPQLFQNSPSSSSLEMTPQNNELLRELLKAQLENGAIQQQNKSAKELSRRRPSLMHDSGASVRGHNEVRPLQHPIDSKRMIQHQLSHSVDANALIGQAAQPDPKEEEDEKQKRILSERLDRIERERIQATNLQKNAQKKARTSESVLQQEPLMLAEEGKGLATDSDEDADEQSPADALIERIYAENRRRASETSRAMTSAMALDDNANDSVFSAGDVDRLTDEYERGVRLLPMLVQAMRIQRERRQDTLENRRIIYEEQLTQWERKVMAYERSPKKLAKDLKHRELFEKTFVELRKSREEKERNTRVERSRFSLAQGGNGIPIASSETLIHFVSSNELPENEQVENDGENVHEKAFAAAIVPPTYQTRPNRFFDNRNSIVENPLAEACAQIEAFQNKWTELERDVFMEKIAIYGKNFAAIAAFLPSKNVKECVQFYYMTKKRNNYKQKIGRRRKKIGRQGYRPPVMPRFGDSDENAQLRNYGRECTFVECLLCGARILVLESLSLQSRHEHPSFDHFGPVPSSSLSQQQQIPICTKCQTQAQRNRTLNRCPLGICTCVGGKRKMRPVRNVPEKFASLSFEHKRFLISRLKIPPSTSKCCTNCFKRISKEIEGLLLGELNAELDEFNNRSAVKTEKGTVKPSLIGAKDGDETEQMAESKSELGEDLWASLEGPPVKEMKLETKAEEEGQFFQLFGNEAKSVPMETEPIITEKSLRANFGSLTKGIPNRRHRSSLLGAWDLSSDMTPDLLTNSGQQIALLASVDAQQKPTDTTTHLGKVTETTSVGPSQFTSHVVIKEAVSTLETKSDEMVKIGQARDRAQTMAKADKDRNSDNEIRGQENVRRKSGLANALLPSPLPDAFAGPTNSRLNSHRIASPACVTATITEPSHEEDTQKDKELSTTMLPPTAQSSLSCYESLSEESDNEKDGEEVKAPIKQKPSTLCSASIATAPLNFFSLLDLMDENEDSQQTMAEDPAGVGVKTDAGPSFSTVSSLQSQPQQHITIFSTAGQWEEANKMEKSGTERGEAECVYEPLSEDEA